MDNLKKGEMKMPTKLNVTQKENEDPIPVEILAQSIKKISDSFKRMKAAGLSDRAIVVLLHDASGIGKPAIKCILAAMEDLERLYLKKAKS